MSAPTASATPSPEVWILATTPPPVTGMTLLTEQVVRGVQAAGPVRILDSSPGMAPKGLIARLTRIGRILGSLATLLRHGRVRGSRMYIAANSKGGLYLTAILVFVCRRLGYRVYLHHHAYYYIDCYDRRMAWIDRCMGQQGVHVVHCDKMARDFAAMYASQCGFACICPGIVSTPLQEPRSEPHTPFSLGHLSNLSVAKGLDQVLATFRALHNSGRKVTLRLAGPCHTRQSHRLVQQALADYQGSIEYIGPVYGEKKLAFLQGIDCFLFPSRSESWGIVLHEAMAAGVPVIAYDRGCTRTAVGPKAGLVIDGDAPFVDLATERIQRWIDQPHEFADVSRAAVRQADSLRREGEAQLAQFANHLFSPGSACPASAAAGEVAPSGTKC
jgi:glycosyltransferase involved in cell wall biosynthesis